ncbi:MAG: BatA and WFA domain-containing protein [Desulfococcaceae bacterium]|jgi:hypothetical protein|nr:BatA and WFA domain-containing protein [Desulfococcaceae bacterium]
MLSFLFPHALWGFAAVPLLVLIYMLRRKHREHIVSSLILWENSDPPDQSGIRIRKLRSSLLFFLELLIICCLVAAAAGPRVRTKGNVRPLTLILDNSLSMRAAEKGHSFREKGAGAMQKILDSRSFHPVRVMLAGEKTEMLPRTSFSLADHSGILKHWSCFAPASRLEEALAGAKEISGKEGLILIISDRAPAFPLSPGVRWIAVGKALPNTAFVNGVRSHWEGKDRVLLEVCHYSPRKTETKLHVMGKDEFLSLEPGIRKEMVFGMREKSLFSARLPEDALKEDNELLLFPPPEKKAGTGIRIVNPALHAVVQRAVRASGLADFHAPVRHILFTDSRESLQKEGKTWTVFLVSEQNARAYKGPFVADYSHPLLKGIRPEGLIWGAGAEKDFPGTALISAGDIPLLTYSERVSGINEIRIRMNVQRSTLPLSPVWPGLIWNLMHWRIAELPGLKEFNVRAGKEVFFIPDKSVRKVQVTFPDRREKEIPEILGKISIHTDQPGVYSIRSGKGEAGFAVNFFSPEESDLSECRSGEWGNWENFLPAQEDYLALDRFFLLPAFCALLLHLIILQKKQGSA